MKTLKVTAKHSGSRLDLFLKDSLNISRAKAKAMIDAGLIFLGKKKIIIASWELSGGETITAHAADSKQAVPRTERFLKVHYEDADVIVIEKPAGVPCESTAQSTTSTVVDDLNDYLKRTLRVHQVYLGLMHRLDTATSGLMVYSKSKAGNQLSLQFKKHTIKRRYVALVERQMEKSQGTILKAIGKDPTNPKKQIVVNNAAKKDLAISEWEVLERYTGATLVQVSLLTGKTHQVRVHLASLGHPVWGDRLYGDKRKNDKRLMLHAAHLSFAHPVTGKPLKFNCSVPKDFLKIIDQLRD